VCLKLEELPRSFKSLKSFPGFLTLAQAVFRALQGQSAPVTLCESHSTTGLITGLFSDKASTNSLIVPAFNKCYRAVDSLCRGLYAVCVVRPV